MRTKKNNKNKQNKNHPQLKYSRKVWKIYIFCFQILIIFNHFFFLASNFSGSYTSSKVNWLFFFHFKEWKTKLTCIALKKKLTEQQKIKMKKNEKWSFRYKSDNNHNSCMVKVLRKFPCINWKDKIIMTKHVPTAIDLLWSNLSFINI